MKDCHSDVSPVNNSDSDSEVITLDTIAALMECWNDVTVNISEYLLCPGQ